MRKKLLIVFICLLTVVMLASCTNVDNPIDNGSKPDLSIAVDVTDKTQTNIELKDKQTTKSPEVEKPQEEIKDDKVNNTEVTNNSNENAETKKDVSECILSVRCDAVFENMDKLNKEKTAVLPQNGIIFPKTKVVFYDGESVFNVLTRELKKKGIHIDFVNTPMYNTVYIKGISNLYERDCGELSGWIYMVNDKVPGCGCSQYTLKNGDKIEFVYTCALGKDVD